MLNENEMNVSEQENVGANDDYIKAIKEMKQNSVSKTEYEKLKAENRTLLQTLVDGGSIEVAQDVPPVDVDAIRKELFSEDCTLNNLQYISKALELRDAVMAKGEADPFLPVYSQGAPTAEDVEKAEAVAAVFKECVEYAAGDSQIFTQELMRRTNDSRPMSNAGRGRR